MLWHSWTGADVLCSAQQQCRGSALAFDRPSLISGRGWHRRGSNDGQLAREVTALARDFHAARLLCAARAEYSARAIQCYRSAAFE